MLGSHRYAPVRDIEMLGPAIPFRPNAQTIQGTAALWHDAELRVDVWLRDNHRKARFFAPGQAHFALERSNFAEFLALGSRTVRERVWVEVPDRSRTEHFRESEWVGERTSVSSERGYVNWVETPHGVQRHGQLWPADPLRRRSRQWPDRHHSAAASALILPRALLNGQSPVAGSEKEIEWNGRAAFQFTCVPSVDPTSRESVATDDVPHHELEGADCVEFVIDAERNVILEWRCIFEDQVYRRFWFEDLVFDEPIDPALFDIDAGPKPPPVIDDRPPRPPEVLLLDAAGAPLQRGDLRVWRWLVGNALSEQLDPAHASYPHPVSVGAEARFFIHSVPPQGCTAFFEPDGDYRSSIAVHTAPVGAAVTGTQNVGRFGPSEGGTLVRLPCPANAGTYTVKLNATWPPPFNSPDPPHPDVPVYFAMWVFAVTTPGNPDFIAEPGDSGMGVVVVTSSDPPAAGG